MELTKRELNKKLKSKVLRPEDRINSHIRNVEIRVVRATSKVNRFSGIPLRSKTHTTIRIKGEVQSTRGEWLSIGNGYGPRAIRNFLRKNKSGVTQEVSSWVKLWGFPSDVELENIELVGRLTKV
tara:strand:+ start:1519 stop:1893 length:375 start_codon:yes stop_codon:yes gene_type:complete